SSRWGGVESTTGDGAGVRGTLAGSEVGRRTRTRASGVGIGVGVGLGLGVGVGVGVGVGAYAAAASLAVVALRTRICTPRFARNVTDGANASRSPGMSSRFHLRTMGARTRTVSR